MFKGPDYIKPKSTGKPIRLELEEQQAICTNCGKPIANKPRTNVTRFLADESRCTCAPPRTSTHDSEIIRPEKGTDGRAQLTDKEMIDLSAAAADMPEYFEVLSLIGEGGMGAVYKARDKRLDKTFAVKILRPALVENLQALERFKKEAVAARSLTHVNVVAMYDFGLSSKGAAYLVMDLLEGDNLKEAIEKEHGIAVPRAIDLFIEIAEAVAHAHLKGVIHRDIKPTNVILVKNPDGSERAKLVDFGIAKVMPKAGENTHGLTQTGEIFGSPQYMSPEQCLGNEADFRSDIYAFGCVMYEALAGRPLFAEENPVRIILKQVTEVPSIKAKKGTPLSSDLDYVMMRCIEKIPADRYQSMQDLLIDLELAREHKRLKRVVSSKQAFKQRSNRQFAYIVVFPLLLLWILASLAIQNCIQLQIQIPPEIQADLERYIFPGDNDGFMLHPDADTNRLEELALHYFDNGDYQQSIPLLEFGAHRYRETGNKSKLAEKLQKIGWCYHMLGRDSEAQPYYKESLALYKSLGHYEDDLFSDCAGEYTTVLRSLNEARSL